MKTMYFTNKDIDDPNLIQGIIIGNSVTTNLLWCSFFILKKQSKLTLKNYPKTVQEVVLFLLILCLTIGGLLTTELHNAF